MVQQRHHYEKLLENGAIEEKHAVMVLNEINGKIKELKTSKVKIGKIDIKEKLHHSELGKIFSKAVIDELYEKLQKKPDVYNSGDTVNKKESNKR